MNIGGKILRFFKQNSEQQFDYNQPVEQPKIYSFDDIFKYKSVSFNIAGVEYDIMNKEDVEKIPCLPAKADIFGSNYGIDYILRKNAVHIYRNNGDYDLAGACIRKSNELTLAGFGTKGSDEIEREKRSEKNRQKQEINQQTMIDINNHITVGDMAKFSNLPFELRLVLNLQHTNGIAWFSLNKNNQYIALSALNYINNIFAQANSYLPDGNEFYICTENICFDYIRPISLDSLPGTYVECTPYTITYKKSKYPMVLHFTEVEGEPFFLNRSSYGAISFMYDGNIGKADITIGNSIIQLRLIGISLIVRRIDRLVNNSYQNIFIYET